MGCVGETVAMAAAGQVFAPALFQTSRSMAELWKAAGVRAEISRNAGSEDAKSFALAREDISMCVLPTSTRWTRRLALCRRAGGFSRLPLKRNPGDLCLFQCEMSSELLVPESSTR